MSAGGSGGELGAAVIDCQVVAGTPRVVVETPCKAAGGAGRHGVLRLRQAIRFANDLATLRTTRVRDRDNSKSFENWAEFYQVCEL